MAFRVLITHEGDAVPAVYQVEQIEIEQPVRITAGYGGNVILTDQDITEAAEAAGA